MIEPSLESVHGATIRIPWSRPDIGSEEKKAVQRVMDSGWLSQGKETEAFERELAEYIGCKHVIAVNNGTSALLCALMVNETHGDIIRVPAYTFPATWNVINVLGLSDFADINPKTFLMEPPDFHGSLNMPVSLAGLPLDAEQWEDISIIEDGCEALGSETKTMKTGSRWVTCFSFHIAKLVTTIEGGAIATDGDSFAHECRLVRSHGEDPEEKYRFVRNGLNFRTTDVNSTIGRVQLRKIKKYLDNRAKIASYYREELEGLVDFQEVPDYVKTHSNMFFPILIKQGRDPNLLALNLLKEGIETRRPFPPAVDLPNATAIYKRILAIPIYNTMKIEDAEYVCQKIKTNILT